METKPVEHISMNELAQKMNEGEFTQVVNVLEPNFYNLGSIKGSLHIPASELANRVNELDKKQEVVTYCAGQQCDASDRAAEELAALGFNVKCYKGGIEEWKDAGLPTEGGETIATAA